MNIIQKQYLHLTINGTEADGLALQQRAAELCREWLIPAIEQVLDRIALPWGIHVRLDRLELDLGQVSWDRLEQEVVEKLTVALSEAINKAPGMLADFGEEEEELPPNSVKLLGPAMVAVEAWLHFLETGLLPWSYRLPNGQTLEQAASQNRFLKALKIRILEVLRQSQARERLVGQFSDGFLQNLLRVLAPSTAKSVESGLSALRQSPQPTELLHELERLLWLAAFERIAEKPSPKAPKPVARALEMFLQRLAPDQRPVAAQQLDGVVRFFWPQHEKEWAKVRKNVLENTDYQIITPKKSRTSIPENEGVYLDNAGLILLHPFMIRFLEGVGVVEKGAMLQPERGMCLLQHLATGQTAFAEHELLLPKLLCGWPLEEPPRIDFSLTEADQEEADAVLRAVIKYWEALRNTSPDGLRGTFLCRPGKLSRKSDGDWLLQVERQTYDLLLDHLPWGYAMIKFPWMRNMLWVEW